jgi:hypothetical protein
VNPTIPVATSSVSSGPIASLPMMLWSMMRCWISGSSPMSTWAITEQTTVTIIARL